MLKIVFFGTPEYVIPVLDKVNKTYRNSRERGIVAVVTQPPKNAGRDNKLTFSEVDHWAHKHNIPRIFDFDKIPEADLGIVASYGRIIPQSVINKFKYGILNIHPSLLPKYRGASPVQETIKNGDSETGVSVILMDKELDHGPIVSSFKERVESGDTTESLRNRLFERSANFIVELIPHYVEGKTKLKKQDHEEATFTKQIQKSDAFIEAKQIKQSMETGENAQEIERLVRAMQPWPQVWTILNLAPSEDKKDKQKRLKILSSHLEDGKLVIDEVQMEGKNPVSWKQFREGYPHAKFE